MIVRNALSLGVGGGDFLAGRASDDDFGEIAEIGAQTIGGELADVGVHDAAGMAGGEDGATPRVDFARRDGSVAGPFEAFAPSASGSAEKVKNTHNPPLT